MFQYVTSTVCCFRMRHFFRSSPVAGTRGVVGSPTRCLVAKAFQQRAVVDAAPKPEPAGGVLAMRQDVRVRGPFADAVVGPWDDRRYII